MPRSELLAALWPDVTVSDDALNSALRDARRAAGDDGRQQTVLATLRGRGVRFVAQVMIEEQPAARLAGDDGPPDPFVGREQPLSELLQACRAARDGRGGLVLAPGAPGVGKSRLLAELARIAGRSDLAIASAWCRRSEKLPYRPWTQLLRRLAAKLDDDALRRLARRGGGALGVLVPELTTRLALPPKDAHPPTDAVRAWLFEEIARFLGEIAGETTLLLTIDDAHWADEASRDLLDFVTEDLPARPVLLVAAFRDVGVEGGSESLAWLPDLMQRSHVRTVPVPALDEDSTRDLAAALTGEPRDGDVVDRIARRSSGNAFFLRELASHVGRGARPETIPRAARDSVLSRFRQLPEFTRSVLHAAASVGEAFDPPLLEAALSTPAAPVLHALTEAADAGIVARRDGCTTWSFLHALVHEIVMDDLDDATREEMHARIAEALEMLHADDARPPWEELARHAHAGRRVAGRSRAVSWGLRAAEAAAEMLAPERASAVYRQVLEVLDEMPEAERDEALAERARGGRAGRRTSRDSDPSGARRSRRRSASAPRGRPTV